MNIEPKTKLTIQHVNQPVWTVSAATQDVLEKLKTLPEHLGYVASSRNMGFGFIPNPCYHKADIIKAMFELAEENIPQELLKQVVENQPEQVIVMHDMAETEKQVAKNLFND